MENDKQKENQTQESKEVKEEKKPSMVESAYEASERLKAENERMEANISKLQELKALDVLGGKTEHQEAPKEDDVMTPEKIGKELEKAGW